MNPGQMHFAPLALLVCMIGLLNVPFARSQSNNKTPDAAQLVKRLGGQVEIDEQRPGRPIIAIELQETKVADHDVAQLGASSDMRSVERICLAATAITDASLQQLARFEQLEELVLNSTKVTDAGLKHLAALPKLTHLNAQGTKATGQSLSELRHLKTLALTGDLITDKTLLELGQLKDLEDLLLAYTKVTDDGLKHLQNFKQLKRLHIRSGRITDAGLVHLQSLRQLERLEIPSTPHVSDEAVARLRQVLPNLHVRTFREGEQTADNKSR